MAVTWPEVEYARGVVTLLPTSTVDEQGRSSFTAFWFDSDGMFRPEPSKRDGEPVGYRRAQCFRRRMTEIERSWAARGYRVVVLPPDAT